MLRLPARALDQDSGSGADQGRVELKRDRVLQFGHLPDAAPLFFFRYIVGQFPCLCLLAGGILERVCSIETKLANQIHRHPVLRFRFRWKPGNNVGTQSRTRNRLPDFFDKSPVVIHSVCPFHQRKDPVGTRLDREMDGGAEVRFRRDRLDQPVGHVLRVRRCKANTHRPVHTGYGPHQLGKIVPAVVIRIHILPEQRDFAEPPDREVCHLFNHTLQRPAPLPPACERHDTERTELVASPHDRNPGAYPVRPERDDVAVVLHA